MKVVFMHIPKCAGTSLHQLLKSEFQNGLFCCERLNHLDKIPLEQLKKYDYFSGHYDAWRIGLIPGPKFIFTFFRDPKSRVISLYQFWRSHTWSVIEKEDLAGPRIAKSHSFKEFLKIDGLGIPANIDNVLVRLALGPVESHSAVSLMKNDPEEAVGFAIKYYGSLNYIGFTDTIEQDVGKLGERLGFKPQKLGFANQTHEDKSGRREPVDDIVLDDETNRLLDKVTALDYKVFSFFRRQNFQ